MSSSAFRGAPLARAVLAAASLLLVSGFTATAAQAVTPSYGVSTGSGTLTPVDPGTSTPVFGTGQDDETTVVTAPFPVSLYGVTSSSLTVDTNGYVGIGTGTDDNLGSTDDTDFGTPVVVAYNDDLDTTTDGDVRAETRGVAPDRQFVIQWDVAVHGDTNATARFQVIFNEDNADVEVDYGGTLDVADTGWIGTKLDQSELVRPGAAASPYPADGTILNYSPNNFHLTASVPGRTGATPDFTGSTNHLADDVDLDVYSGTDTTAATGTRVSSYSTTPDGFSGAYDVTQSTPLAAGTYTLVASQPSAGLAKTRETFIVDTTAPAGLTLTGPPARSDQPEPTFTGAAGTATGDQQPTVEIHEGSTVSGTVVESVATTGGATYTGTSGGLDDGTYTAQAVQVDDSGNESDSTAVTFTVDTESASPYFSRTPAMQGPEPYFTGFGSDDAGDAASVTVAIFAGSAATGAPVQTYNNVTFDEDGRFTVEGTTLAEGVYTARVSQGDDVGNPLGTDTYTFTVDATAPALTVTGPADGATTTDTQPLFTGTAGRATGDNDTVGIGIYAGTNLMADPVAYVEAPIAADGMWSARPTVALAAGTYTIDAYLYDDAGNATSVLRTLTVAGAAAAAVPVPAAPAPVTIPAPPVAVCKGNRVLHKSIARPSGTHLKVSATINGKKVKATIGRKAIAVVVDLRGKVKGTYKLRVLMTRKQATGKRKTVTTTKTYTYKVCL
ncbi:MAG: hypothetical protein JWQ18_2976 [Conexibacter sp.]|nr:hypothetical protein [Conexibacter sp.]